MTRSAPFLLQVIKKGIGQQIHIGPMLALEAWSRRCLIPFLPPLSVAAVIPGFSEAATIGRIVARSRQHVDTVIVVDEGSVDVTAALGSRAGAEVVAMPVIGIDHPCRTSMTGDLP